jgi:hypothetical protein
MSNENIHIAFEKPASKQVEKYFHCSKNISRSYNSLNPCKLGLGINSFIEKSDHLTGRY